MSAPQRHKSLLVAVSHDSPTSFVYLAHKKAKAILEVLNVPIREFTHGDFNLKHIYVDLMADKVDGYTYVIGVLIAHGSRNEKGLVEGEGELLFEKQTAKELSGAVLLLCSCLRSGHFATRIVQQDIGVRAVIGYKDKLRIMPRDLMPSPWHWAYWYPWSWYHSFRIAFNDALLVPLSALIIDKCSIDQACKKGQDAWMALVGDKSYDARIRHVLVKNVRNLTHWPTTVANQKL